MYRVFEALDELVRMADDGFGVPMTSNCIVPRNEMLALLDDLRNSLPVELDDAQDVLDRRDEVLRDAETRAKEQLDDAESEAEETLTRAREEAEGLVTDAEARASSTVQSAEEEADDIVARAHREADRLVADGNEAYQQSVNEGLAEQNRLVAESEVARRANEEAHRVVDAAHADSKQLRQECDDFVDNKLAEFEETLSNVLRTVTKDRQALRRGAGAGGREYRYRSEDRGER